MNKFNLRTLLTVSTIVGLIILIIMVVARPYRVTGDCMEPAIADGKLYFLNKLTPYMRKYKKGDIILFTHENKVWISRVAALENDTIRISQGSISVNNVALEDKTIKRNWQNWNQGTYAINKSFVVPEGHVFVLSDNLASHHDDSRVFGPINKSSILGVVW